MEVKRKDAFNATFRQGKQTRTIQVTPKKGGSGVAATAGNILVGGVIGAAVDAGNGATLDHVPNPVHADFAVPQPKIQAAAEAHAIKIQQAAAEQRAENKTETTRPF